MGKVQTTTIQVEGIGEVRIARRAGMTRMRLTVTPRGPLLSIPWFTPRLMAIGFLAKNADWLKQHMHAHTPDLITSGARIGKTHRVRFVFTTGRAVTSRTSKTLITIAHPRATTSDSAAVQNKARQAAIRVLKQQAEAYLPGRLTALSEQLNLPFNELRIRRMTSRWGSCSSTKLITLNIFLMQLPDTLIDYVLVHELIHTKHMDHSADFWRSFEHALPGAKSLRRSIKSFSPVLQPVYDEPQAQ